MYWYESWTITKAKHWRIWCFWIVVLQKILESPLESKDIKPVNPKGNQTWIFIGRADAEAETPILWKRPWCWGRLKAGGEGDDRGWDDWMASLTWWTWVWTSSRSWWRTRKPGILQSLQYTTIYSILLFEVANSQTWLSDWTEQNV